MFLFGDYGWVYGGIYGLLWFCLLLSVAYRDLTVVQAGFQAFIYQFLFNDVK